ncbi:hypothetical protein KDRO_A01600 [Kluyveromyces lactis]|nr:hypothetical protein KDRO_A01600 [Kluyveromyces lactis]
MTDVRDCMGRTLSYHLSMWPAANDSQLKRINLKDQDWESGYTAFHLCMLSFQLEKCYKLYARSLQDPHDAGKSWQITDKSGMSPLLLLQSMVMNKAGDRRKLLNKATKSGKSYSRCFNFGSNVNMQLGTGDNNDRLTSWYEIDSWKMCDNDLRFKSCCMTKYYSLLLMVDKDGTSSAYITGRSTKLNLFGKRDLFRYVKFSDKKLQNIKCSNHHIIAKTTNGNILLWGSNKFGQLGLNPKTIEFSDQPNSIELGLGKDDLIACSNIHTCVLSKSGSIKSWGLDVGQFGSTSKFKKETPYLDQKGQISPQPVTSFLPADINEPTVLVCTDFVTFILCGGNRLFALTNYRILTVKTTPSLHDSFDKFFSRKFHHHQIVDIKCKDSHGKNLMLLYDDGTVACIPDFKKSPIPQCFWRPKYSWDKCISFDTGSDGQLIVLTAKSDIYSSPLLGRKFTKLQDSIAGASSCQVSCDPLFASFNVLTAEHTATITEPEFKQQSNLKLNDNYDLEVIFNGKRLTSCHRAILAAAQEKLYLELITNGKIVWRNKLEAIDMNLNTENGYVWTLEIFGPEDFGIYFKTCISCYYSVSDENLQVLNCATLQNFIDVYYLPSFFTQPSTLERNIKISIQPDFPVSPNVTLLLEDGKSVLTHSFILQAHSMYFRRLFSQTWSANFGDHKVDWTDLSYDISRIILDCIYNISCQKKSTQVLDKIAFNMGHQRYHDKLLHMLEISDKFMILTLVQHLESQLISSVNSNNVIAFWIAASDFNLPDLAVNCQEYIFRNPSVLFNSDTVEHIMKNITSEMWKSIEQKFKTELGICSQESWYYGPKASDYIRQLEKNIIAFNSHFISEENPLEILVDSVIYKKPRQKSGLDVRKPSISKTTRSSSINENLVNIRRPSAVSQNSIAWNKPYNMTDSAIEDDDDQSTFVEVSKKKKRRPSSVTRATSIDDKAVHEIHANMDGNRFLVRKNSSEHAFPALGETTNRSNSTVKIKIKKETQKEKIKRMAEEAKFQEKPNEDKTKVWGKHTSKSPLTNKQSTKVTVSSELKSLSGVKPASTKFPSLHEAVKNGKKPTGIVPISGDGTKQTMPLYASTKSNLSWVAKETTPAPTKSIQEALEEAKFLKWWNEESQKIQAQQAASEMLMGMETGIPSSKPGSLKKSSLIQSNGKRKSKSADKSMRGNKTSKISTYQPEKHDQTSNTSNNQRRSCTNPNRQS